MAYFNDFVCSSVYSMPKWFPFNYCYILFPLWELKSSMQICSGSVYTCDRFALQDI